MKTNPVSTAELNAALNTVKGQLPPGAVLTLFVFQDAGNGNVSTDYVTNGETSRVAYTVGLWSKLILSGELAIEKDPHGGRVQ